jgi:hypothetical protein
MDNVTYHPKAILQKSEELTLWEKNLRKKSNDIEQKYIDIIEMRREIRYREVSIENETRRHFIHCILLFFIGLSVGIVISTS